MTTIKLRTLAELLSCNNRTIWRIYTQKYNSTWHDKMNPDIDVAKFAKLVNCDFSIFEDVMAGKDRFLTAYDATRYLKINNSFTFYARKYPKVLTWKLKFQRWSERTLRKAHERKYGK